MGEVLGTGMKDIADDLIVAEMTRLARAKYGVEDDLTTLPVNVLEELEDEAAAIVEDLLETECERDLEGRLARLKEAER